jgi:hypothetical protein
MLDRFPMQRLHCLWMPRPGLQTLTQPASLAKKTVIAPSPVSVAYWEPSAYRALSSAAAVFRISLPD